MPISLITNNSAAQNGVVADNIYPGCNDIRLLEEVPGVPQYGDTMLGVGNGVDAHNNSLLMAYGLNRIPAGATVSRAVLHIRTGAAGFNSPTVAAHMLAVDAEITNSTWNERLPGEAWASAGGMGVGDIVAAAMDTQVVAGASSWQTFNVLEYAQAVVNGGENLGIILGTLNPDGDDGFWFLERCIDDTADGIRWQIEVEHTGGTPNGNIPIQNSAIDFTGANGSPAPAPLVPRTGTFAINGNALRASGSHPPDTIGWKIGADTGEPNGIVSATYNANGGTGDDTGIMVRYVDADNFWDVVNASGIIYLVNILGGSIALSSPGYSIPSYDASTDYEVDVHLDGDEFTVYVDSVEAIHLVNSSLHRATIHGAKFAGLDASIDNLVLPGELFPAGITNITGTLAAGESLTLDLQNFDNPITSVAVGGVELTIDAQAGDQSSVDVTLAADAPLGFGIAYDVVVTDGVKTATLESQTLAARSTWNSVYRDGTVLDYDETEGFDELVFNDAGFVVQEGDQLQYSEAAGLDLVRTDSTFRRSQDVSGLFAYFRPSTGVRTADLPYRWETPNSTPNQFSIPAVNDAARSSVQSSSFTFSGSNQDASISVSGPTGSEYRINGGAWTSVDGVVPHDATVEARGVASADYQDSVTVTITIDGSVSADLVITTEMQPASFLRGEVYLLPYSAVQSADTLVRLIGNTMELFLSNLRSPSDQVVNDATVEAVFTDGSGNPVAGVANPLTMANASANGDYRAALPHDVDMDNEAVTYTCSVTAVDPDNNSRFQSINKIKVKKRDRSDESRLRSSP